MKKYHLHVNGINYGPYSIEELRSMQITRETLAWYQGLDTWKPAGEIPELSTLFSYSQPASYVPPSYNQPYNQPSYQQPYTPYSQPSGYVPPATNPYSTASPEKKKNNAGVVIGIIAGVLVIFIVVIAVYVNNVKKERERRVEEMSRMMDSLYAAEQMPVEEAAPITDTTGINGIVYGWDFTGTFESSDGGSISVSGSDYSNMYVVITYTSSSGNCYGSVSGYGIANGGTNILFTTNDGCEIRLSYSDTNTITVSESYNCSNYHGSKCNFEGTYRRK